MIKGYLEEPRHCRVCKRLTLEFFPGRVKRNDWICKNCHIQVRQLQFVRRSERRKIDDVTHVIDKKQYRQEGLF